MCEKEGELPLLLCLGDFKLILFLLQVPAPTIAVDMASVAQMGFVNVKMGGRELTALQVLKCVCFLRCFECL